jgi:hypothetical protein
MRIGQKVRLKHDCDYARENNRHNPTEVTGVIVEIGNDNEDRTRTKELPVVVDWGGFTNSYKFIHLYEV